MGCFSQLRTARACPRAHFVFHSDAIHAHLRGLLRCSHQGGEPGSSSSAVPQTATTNEEGVLCPGVRLSGAEHRRFREATLDDKEEAGSGFGSNVQTLRRDISHLKVRFKGESAATDHSNAEKLAVAYQAEAARRYGCLVPAR